ncbi:restriction endonuclease subunit S [Gluconobacter aidae]|uniref:Restriction endonuclease subunit S n=1 Tax=Gluconobacter aidae TaxID=2662454 RepID=A0A7X1SSZ4_9PROT|nr:restriction endonuclease subunit S [Gluconobacter aidae]MQS00060.1 restriction endonuclease subunit S [Gluconobacter aidae]
MIFFKKVTTQELIADKFLEIGDGYRAKNSEMAATGIPFIRAGDVDGAVRISGADYLSDASARTAGRKRSLPGDVVITTKGTIGRLAFVHPNSPEFIYSPQICFWRSLDQSVIDSRWLFFAMQSPFMREQMEWSAAQTDMAPYISLLDQRTAFSLLLPPIKAQRSITSILGALDDKIDLNRRTNETLEAMARALFRDWFVDFGPTRAKMAGQAPYLAPEIWKLFPDKLDDEGKPEGWERESLDETATFLNGLALQKYPANGSAYLPAIKIAQLRSENTEAADPVSPDLPPDYIVEQNDLLFSWSGSLLCKFWNGPRGALNQHLFKVTSKRFSSWFIYECIQYYMPEFQAIAAAKATTMGHIQRRHLTESLVTVPHSNTMQAANAVIGNLHTQIQSNNGESQTLAQIRDLLLPKLMSGEIRIRDAEKMVADAL